MKVSWTLDSITFQPPSPRYKILLLQFIRKPQSSFHSILGKPTWFQVYIIRLWACEIVLLYLWVAQMSQAPQAHMLKSALLSILIFNCQSITCLSHYLKNKDVNTSKKQRPLFCIINHYLQDSSLKSTPLTTQCKSIVVVSVWHTYIIHFFKY